MDAELRPATSTDAIAVAGLWTEAYVTRGVSGRSEPYSAADFERSLREGEVHVAENEGSVVGVVVLRGPSAPGRAVAGEGEAELSRLAVSIGHRGGGIGRALAELCRERARRAGWPAIALWSRPGQVEAHRLYESLGYRRLPERDTIDASGRPRVVFRLVLPRGPAAVPYPSIGRIRNSDRATGRG
ncbi:MAG TPA: GNAT family N-acetyltransferase [Solirubrobacterales bacterium]|jgi:ribosomal protein S18 acetylase RimI-like enzyme